MRILSLFLSQSLASSLYRRDFTNSYTRGHAYFTLFKELKSSETQSVLQAARPSLGLANRCMDKEKALLDKCLRKGNCRYYAMNLPLECERQRKLDIWDLPDKQGLFFNCRKHAEIDKKKCLARNMRFGASNVKYC